MKPWSQLTDRERIERAKKFRTDSAARHEAVVQRNASLGGVVPPWPQPRFLTPELETLVARDISERPLHGVPSVYRTEAQSVTNIMREQLQRAAIALAVPRSRPATFLSVADIRILKARIMNPETPSSALREYRARLAAHKPYRGI